MSVVKKWLLTLLILLLSFYLLSNTLPQLKKCIIYFNVMSFFISIIFMFINILAENQTASGKLAYTLGSIGNKFILSIIAFIGYFYTLYKGTKIEILTAFGIYFTYFIISYLFLFQLGNKKISKLK
jgi:hypothetical protein